MRKQDIDGACLSRMGAGCVEHGSVEAAVGIRFAGDNAFME
jgi:hypothetical protein